MVKPEPKLTFVTEFSFIKIILNAFLNAILPKIFVLIFLSLSANLKNTTLII